ncbi:MAG: NAD-dependent epimerase/dehydratase family protein [Chloroflexi bacterium AL-N5]|nr:NAD-dependent epimerase/dehydratase family protein [Chloroflexi bacterium AL-N5]
MNSLTTKSPLQPSLITVFGCTGATGTEVIRQLATHDCSVRGILREANRPYPVPHQEKPARVSYVTTDYDSVDHRMCWDGCRVSAHWYQPRSSSHRVTRY